MKILRAFKCYVDTLILDYKIRRKNIYSIIRKECNNVSANSIVCETELINEVLKNNQVAILRYFKIIDKVCLIYMGDAKCLHRSILQYRYLRNKFGLPVKIVVGVKKFPFAAHAWIRWMTNNQEVYENSEGVAGYKVIFDSERDIQRVEF